MLTITLLISRVLDHITLHFYPTFLRTYNSISFLSHFTVHAHEGFCSVRRYFVLSFKSDVTLTSFVIVTSLPTRCNTVVLQFVTQARYT